MSDEYLNQTLEFTDAKRRKLLEELEKGNNGVIPTDTDSANLYLKALKDLDSAAISHARVKTEEKQVDNDSAVAEIIRDVVRQMDGRNPFRAEKPIEGRSAPELPKDIEEAVVVDESLMETGKVQESVEDFNRRMGLED